MLLANHGALTVGADLFGAYYKMETIEHFAKISLVARTLGRENLIIARRSRRACRAFAARTASRRRRRSALIRARRRLAAAIRRPARSSRRPPAAERAWCPTIDARGGAARAADDEGEIRLTYRELSALIEDAIRSLR